jgi:hypothetical protein
MKTKVRIIGAGLLALLLMLTGCFTPLNDSAAIADEGSGTKLVVEVGGLDARTLAPTNLSGVKYNVTIRDIKDYYRPTVTEAEDVDFLAPQEYPLKPGDYEVGVWAYTGDYKSVAWGSTDVTLENGKTEHLKIILKPTTGDDVPGTFSYSVDYPAALGYSWASLWLDSSNNYYPANQGKVFVNLLEDAETKAETKTKSGSLTLPPGKYTLTVTMNSNRQIGTSDEGFLRATAKETVYIYPNLETSAKYAFSEKDFSASVYFAGTAKINSDIYPGYVPEKVRIKLDGYDDDSKQVQEANITGNAKEGYSWELSVLSDKLSPSQVNNVQFQLTAIKGSVPVESKWFVIAVADEIYGKTGIILTIPPLPED